jgi:hypothetical protein
MPYFKSIDLATIALSSGLWGVLNSIFSPIFFQMFGLPFLCDLIGFSILAVAVWWTRKLGSVTVVGLIATVINFIFNPAAIQFLGFTAASVVFDIAAWLIRYDNVFRKTANIAISMISISTLSAAVAGFIIGIFFMVAPALAKWGGVLGWAGLHAVGGVMGGVIGVLLVTALIARGIQTQVKQTSQLGKQANAL